MKPVGNRTITRSNDTARGRMIIHRAAFTLTELLVVIGIIALLIAILLTALAHARAKALETSTLATMEGFRQACETYRLEQGQYPGIVPDRVLAFFPEITSTESAALALMGGYRVLAPNDVGTPIEDEYNNYSGIELSHNVGSQTWKVKIDFNRIGEGPWVKGKSFAPYFTPKESEFGTNQGVQTNETEDDDGVIFVTGLGNDTLPVRLPDLLDGWGQPIIYARRVRAVGAIVGNESDDPQFIFANNALVGTSPYVQSVRLGSRGEDQTSSGGEAYSILNMGGQQEKIDTWSQVLAHPALKGEPRGAITLISAGRDGIYFSRTDGAGSSAEPITEVGAGSVFYDDQGPSVIDDFDDIRVFGGD